MNEHGPAAGCNYRVCGLDDVAACPFVADVQPTATDHVHEYVLVCSCGDIKSITTSKGNHGIVTAPNRGGHFLD